MTKYDQKIRKLTNQQIRRKPYFMEFSLFFLAVLEFPLDLTISLKYLFLIHFKS